MTGKESEEMTALGFEGPANGDDVYHASAAVEGGEDLFGGIAAAQLRDGLGAGAVAGQVHAAQKRMAAPGARELVGALFRDEVVAAQSRRNILLGGAFLPGQPGGLVLRVVLEESEEHAQLHVVVGKLFDFGHAMGDQDPVVGDSFR